MKTFLSVASIAAVPLLALCGAFFGHSDVFSVAAAFCCCVPFFLSFEKRTPSARELVLIAVMTAFSVVGRFAFAPLPFFKPVAAVVILAGMHLGANAGFMAGALSALISNIYFGQGAWTPFQMFCWGFIGFAAGLINRRKLLEKPLLLCIYGAAAGAFYSLVMDVWTTLSADGAFTISRYIALVAAALPITAIYCVSDALFLLLLRKPIGKRLERIKTKYAIFGAKEN